MNKKIKELVELATQYTRMHHNNAYWRPSDEFIEDTTWKNKFAELIIRETTDIIIKSYRGHINPAIACEAIKEHFGVK